MIASLLLESNSTALHITLAPLAFAIALVTTSVAVAGADTLDKIRERGVLIWGADAEGGGPYVFADPQDPKRVIGFEVDLAERLAKALGVTSQFYQADWNTLPALLKTGQIDVILNGYELTPSRAGIMAYTTPYYIYDLALIGRKNNPALRGWDDLKKPIEGERPRVGVLGGSQAHHHLQDNYGSSVEIVLHDGTTSALREVETGKLHATVTDNVAAIFYADRFNDLEQLSPGIERGYYVIYLRTEDQALKQSLDHAFAKFAVDGTLKELYEPYGIWNDDQNELAVLAQEGPNALDIKATRLGGWEVIRSRGPLMLASAWMTVKLACLAMPLAIGAGLFVALIRLYGPLPLRWLAIGYVELLRGTPLMLQLFVIYYLLPEIGIMAPAFYAAIAGLAINYSAYEAEIYRAGLQAIPRGQMEAALALGMSPMLALRRIIVPQAVRLVVPPVTNDFIALFKDTSVCSVITVVELSKQYDIQANDTGATLELAALTALLYLLMSIPLAQLTNYLERRTRGRTQE